MGWDEVLSKILREPTKIDKSNEERPSDAERFKSLNVSKIDFGLEIATDEFVEYHPAKSRARITYNVERIVYYADESLMRVRSSLELPPPTEELIESFRWAFSHFVRRHGIFHYLVQRGSKILMEDNYWDYRNKVYEVRRCVGNLEEALAEAYAITRCQEDLQNLPKYDKIPYEPKELASINKLILERIFINKSRPPGYRDAEYFLNEFKLLYDHPLNIQVLSALANEELWDILKGIGWLFHEITVREAKDFTDPQNPPARPYSRKEFITFLENFRKEEDTFWLFILPLPMEEVSN